MNKQLLTILIPMYNEEEVLDQLYMRLLQVVEEIPAYDFEFLFVDDGSKDRSLEMVQEMRSFDKRVSYISLSRNFGKEIAMMAGFDYARGDALIIIDADLQDPPELIGEMIGFWEQGYDDVFAKRRHRHGETWMKKWTAKTFYRLLQKTTRMPIQENVGDFRLLDRRCVEALKQLRETQRYTKGMFDWIGYRKKEILYDRDERAAGKTKWNYFKLFDLAIEGILSFTTVPLRLSSILGLAISGASFLFLLYIISKTIFFGESVDGYPSLVTVIVLLGGIQLIVIGIIGEYLGRIFIETKKRPLYFVDVYNDKKEENSGKSEERKNLVRIKSSS